LLCITSHSMSSFSSLVGKEILFKVAFGLSIILLLFDMCPSLSLSHTHELLAEQESMHFFECHITYVFLFLLILGMVMIKDIYTRGDTYICWEKDGKTKSFLSFYFILGLSDITCIKKRKDPHFFWFLLKCRPMFSSFSYIYVWHGNARKIIGLWLVDIVYVMSGYVYCMTV